MNSDKLVSGCLKRNSKNPFKRHELRQISIEKPSVSLLLLVLYRVPINILIFLTFPPKKYLTQKQFVHVEIVQAKIGLNSTL